MNLLDAKPGDKVTVRLPSGERTGVVVLTFSDRLILNIGGHLGTPAVATADNIVKIVKGKVQR